MPHLPIPAIPVLARLQLKNEATVRTDPPTRQFFERGVEGKPLNSGVLKGASSFGKKKQFAGPRIHDGFSGSESDHQIMLFMGDPIFPGLKLWHTNGSTNVFCPRTSLIQPFELGPK